MMIPHYAMIYVNVMPLLLLNVEVKWDHKVIYYLLSVRIFLMFSVFTNGD